MGTLTAFFYVSVMKNENQKKGKGFQTAVICLIVVIVAIFLGKVLAESFPNKTISTLATMSNSANYG
jgi:uncharacterized membrane protein